MTDDQFLQYVVTHSQTERHLFSAEDLVRLLKLCHRDALARDVENGSRKFYPLHAEEAAKLVRDARSIIEHAEREAAAKVDAKRMIARQYHVAAERAFQCTD